MFSSAYFNLVIKSELAESSAHSAVQAGTQAQPLGTPLCCRMLLTNLRASMWAVNGRHWLWGMSSVTHMSLPAPGNTHPRAVSCSRVKYKQPKGSQAWSHPAMGVARLLQEQEPAQLQWPADTGQCRVTMGLSFLNHSVCAWSLCVHGHCAPVSFSATKQQRGRKAEHQRHIHHHSADGKHLPGHKLSFLPSDKSLK